MCKETNWENLEKQKKDKVKDSRFERLNKHLKNPHLHINDTDKNKLDRYEFVINSLYNGAEESKLKDWLKNFYKLSRSTAYRDIMEAKEFFNYEKTHQKQGIKVKFKFIYRELYWNEYISLEYLKKAYPIVWGYDSFYLKTRIKYDNERKNSNLLIDGNLSYYFIKFLDMACKNKEFNWFIDYKDCNVSISNILNNVSGLVPIKLTRRGKPKGELCGGVDCVYLISDGTFTKIGSSTKDPIDRLTSLQTANPRPLFLRGVIPYHNYERKVQKEVEKNGFQNLHGEWYNGTPEQIIDCLKSKEFHLEETSIKA